MSVDMIDSPYGRQVKEWRGKTPDSVPPPTVRARVFDRKKGRCHKCTRKIAAGETWTCEHLIAIRNGGENRERNLDVTCCNCLPEKNAADISEKTEVSHIRAKHIGTHKPKRPFPRRVDPWGKNRQRARDVNDDLEVVDGSV